MRPQHMQPQRSNRALTVVLTALVVVLALVAVTSWLALSDPNAGKGLENTPPSNSLAVTAMQAAVTGKEATVSLDEANGYLAYLLEQKSTGLSAGELKIRGIAMLAGANDTADLYIPVTYREKPLAITMNVTPSADSTSNRLKFEVNSLHVGRLPLGPKWALGMIKEKLPENVSLDGTTLTYTLPVMQAAVGNIAAQMKVTELKMSGGNLLLAAKAEVGISA